MKVRAKYWLLKRRNVYIGRVTSDTELEL
jgi:hypothetical protein